MQYTKRLRLPAAIMLASCLVSGGEFAALKTGRRLHVSRCEDRGLRLRLFTPGGCQIDLPASSVVRFEPDNMPAEPEPAGAKEIPGRKPLPLNTLIERLAAAAELPAELIHAMIAEESAHRADAVSSKGAVGLMQLMPRTAAMLAVDPHDPMENIRGGIDYLKRLMERYKGRSDQIVRALAAYNAGPSRVDQYDGIPPYAETRAYVRRVIDRFNAAHQ